MDRYLDGCPKCNEIIFGGEFSTIPNCDECEKRIRTATEAHILHPRTEYSNFVAFLLVDYPGYGFNVKEQPSKNALINQTVKVCRECVRRK